MQSMPEDFSSLELPSELVDAIAELQFHTCTPVQAEVLPHALDGADIVSQAQTGTGKTAAFLITLIAYHLENPEIDPRPAGTPFALIVAPTRELAIQISDDAMDLAKFTDIKIVTLMGGIDYEKQKRQCRGVIDILVATPGRLLDFCRSSVVDLRRIETLVIDEADRMLSMGFIPDIKAIIRQTPRKEQRQTLLFSATLSDDIRRLASQWTQEPIKIEIEPEQVAVQSVTQLVYLIPYEQKYALLYNLITSLQLDRVLVFVNRRDQARHLENRLHRNGINSGLLTGDVPQRKRIRTLEDFKSGNIHILVATDVAGRGIHVEEISHVINYNLPEDSEDYVHRIGRTGRAGAEGISISFACETDAFQIPAIEELLGYPLKHVHPADELLAPTPAPVRSSRPSLPVKKNRRRR
jgi:ATP-dependent RNA helicase RhlB